MTTTTGSDGAAETAGRYISIVTPKATTRIQITPQRLWTIYAGFALGLVWLIVASAGFLMSLVSTSGDVSDADVMERAYLARIAALTAERDRFGEEALSAQDRFGSALGKISEQQSVLLTEVTARRELESTLGAMRDKLAKAAADRDETQHELNDLRLAMADLESRAAQSPDAAAELSEMLTAMNGALNAAVRMRDDQYADLSTLESELASLELRMQINGERQEQLVASLEDAVSASFKPLEDMFNNVGLDVDSLIASVRINYSGVGGPLAPATAASAAFSEPELNARFAALMGDMDRMNMMRIAAEKLPYTVPVRKAHRFTSGFGTRRDPVTGGRRAHNGIDLAGPRGTPIVSTAEGVVVFAGRQSGYGNMIKIRHEFGYETMYAHLNKIHVKVGEHIARGDHIGDMGNTGRSTGVHLHYEVRQGGKPVNPMTFIKAARDVF